MTAPTTAGEHRSGGNLHPVPGGAYTRLFNAELPAVVRKSATDFAAPSEDVDGDTGLYAGEPNVLAVMNNPLGWTGIEGEAFIPGFWKARPSEPGSAFANRQPTGTSCRATQVDRVTVSEEPKVRVSDDNYPFPLKDVIIAIQPEEVSEFSSVVSTEPFCIRTHPLRQSITSYEIAIYLVGETVLNRVGVC